MKTVWKRLSALVLALTMVLSLLSAGAWASDPAPELTIKVETPAEVVSPGKLVAIPVTVTGTAGIAGCALTVNTDNGVTLARSGNELTNGEAGHFATKKGGIFADGLLLPNKGDNTISLLSGDNVSATSQNNLLMTLYVYAPAAAGDYEIKLALADGKASNICNESSETVTAAFVAGTLKVKGAAHVHDFETVGAVAANGCQDGNKAYRYCKTCYRYYEANTDTEIEDLDTIVVKGNGEHDWEKLADECIAPKIRQEGYDVYKCKNCDARKTEEIPALKDGIQGDVDGDGILSITDVVLMDLMVLKSETPTPENLSKWDMDGDGVLSITDVVLLDLTVLKG